MGIIILVRTRIIPQVIVCLWPNTDCVYGFQDEMRTQVKAVFHFARNVPVSMRSLKMGFQI
jgi:hypothetical protein